MDTATVDAIKESNQTTPEPAKTLLSENGLGMGEFLKPSVEPPAMDPPKEEPKAEAVSEAAPEPKAEEKKPEKSPEEVEKASLKKQLKDTRDAFTQERQLRKETERKLDTLNQKLEILDKKFSGTFDETKDLPKTPTPDELALNAAQQERIRTSHYAAVDKYGEDYVQEKIWNDEAPYRELEKDPAIYARVMNAKLPILEAIKVVKEQEDRKKYGDDPEAIREAIRKEERESLKKELRKELMEELKSKKPALETVKGLGGIASATDTKPASPPGLKFESLFGNFTPSAG